MKKIVLLSLSVFAAFSLSAQQPRDWAQYGRYERQNAALAGEPVEVVFMGNSITDNWIGADPDFFARNGFVDRGISGQTTAEMLARFRRDVIDLNPKAVVILAGINDIAQNNGAIKLENVFGNIVSMCELAKFNGIKVLLCSVTPAAYFNWRPQVEPAKIIPKLNKMLREYAEATEGVEWVDYFTPMVGEDKAMRAEYSPEGSHPNGEGYKVMERIVVPAINKIQGTNKKYFIYE